MHTSDVLNPQSPLTRATADLFNTTLIVSAVILTIVAGVALLSVVRFRARPDRPEPGQFRGHKNLEILWTVIPLLLLVYLFVLTVRAMHATDPSGKSGTPDVIVTGHQFWWEIRYPQSGAVTANEIHIPAGRRLLFEVKTADVIHDFWVPQLSRKMDLLPDYASRLWIQANHPGTYLGACAEFCGTQHAWMRILVIAQTPEEFEAWQRHQLQPIPASNTAIAQRGAQLARQLTCVNCHELGGPTPTLQAGPDLRHVGERRTLGAGVVQNTPENLARWIKNPQALKPGNLMPNMHLSDDQVTDLAAYLRTLR